MVRIAIILGSTRPGRNGEAVAKWVLGIAKKRKDAEFENFSVFKPAAIHEGYVNTMLDQLIAWGGVLKTVRKK